MDYWETKEEIDYVPYSNLTEPYKTFVVYSDV